MGGGDQRRNDLHHEFQHSRQRHDVVHYTQHHDDYGAQQNAPQFRRDLRKEQDADHKADEDGQAAQPGDGDLVHPAGVLGDIDGAHLIGKRLDHRRHQKADHQCYQ